MNFITVNYEVSIFTEKKKSSISNKNWLLWQRWILIKRRFLLINSFFIKFQKCSENLTIKRRRWYIDHCFILKDGVSVAYDTYWQEPSYFVPSSVCVLIFYHHTVFKINNELQFSLCCNNPTRRKVFLNHDLPVKRFFISYVNALFATDFILHTERKGYVNFFQKLPHTTTQFGDKMRLESVKRCQ